MEIPASLRTTGVTRVFYHAQEGDPFKEVVYLGPVPGYAHSQGQVWIMRDGQEIRTHIKFLYLTKTWF